MLRSKMKNTPLISIMSIFKRVPSPTNVKGLHEGESALEQADTQYLKLNTSLLISGLPQGQVLCGSTGRGGGAQRTSKCKRRKQDKTEGIGESPNWDEKR